MKLGEKIKLLRTEKELTQPELAQKAGIEQSYLSKLENDKAVPSFDIINRISMVLDCTGMELINSLSQSYVEGKLSHIPEIAAEYAVLKEKRESALKKRFIIAAFFIVTGIGSIVLGFIGLSYPHTSYKYQSKGVIKPDESDLQYSNIWLREYGESTKEKDERISSMKERFNVVYKSLDINKGNFFIEIVDGGKGRRYYAFKEKIQFVNVQINLFILIIGVMLLVSGFMTFSFNKRFKL